MLINFILLTLAIAYTFTNLGRFFRGQSVSVAQSMIMAASIAGLIILNISK